MMLRVFLLLSVVFISAFLMLRVYMHRKNRGLARTKNGKLKQTEARPRMWGQILWIALLIGAIMLAKFI